jgi:hypothetical protein
MQFYPLRLYFKSLTNIICIGVCLLLNFALWSWLFWNIGPQAEPIFLHYNILFGVDYVGPWWQIAFVPATGLVIILINTLLGWLLSSKDVFLAHVLNFISVLIQVILLIVGYLLVFLNV